MYAPGLQGNLLKTNQSTL